MVRGEEVGVCGGSGRGLRPADSQIYKYEVIGDEVGMCVVSGRGLTAVHSSIYHVLVRKT